MPHDTRERSMISRFRFRLVTLFTVVGVIACGLAAAQRWIHVPMRTGTIYSAICQAEDFAKLVASQPDYQYGDFTMHGFNATAPEELFKNFSPKPQLWGEI